MPTIGEIINNLAIKAGVPADDADLKTLLNDPALATIKVADGLASTIENTLLSIEAAKNNHPEIKKVYASQVYDGMDKFLEPLFDKDHFSEEDIKELKAIPLTNKRIQVALDKLKTAKAKATGADKDEINRQIAGLHEAARLAKEETTTVRNDYENKIKDIKRAAVLSAKLAHYKTIYDDLDPSIKSASVEAIINKALQDKNAVLNVDDNGNFTLLSKDGSNVFGSNHVLLTPQSFLDQTVAPILRVSGPPKPALTPPRPQQPANPLATVSEQYAEASSDFIKSHTDQVLADMAKTGPSLI